MVLAFVLWVLGIAYLVYFGAYAFIIGLNNSFTYFWLLLGVVLSAAGTASRMCHNGRLHLPKAVSVALIVCVILFLGAFGVAESAIIKNAVQKPEKNADYIVVLGARVNGTRVTLNLKYRLDVALDYLNENEGTKVVVSGGQGKGEEITEAKAMSDYLVKNGIKSDRIILEDRSKNTNENLKFSAELIGSKEKKTVIVSNDFHIYRAKCIAKKIGYTDVSGASAKTKPITIPNSFVREAFEQEKQKQEDLGLHCEVTIDGYTDFIFINRFGQAQHQATLNKAIRRIIRDCNDEQFLHSDEPDVLLPHFSCHSLRHTFTTRMCEAGVNIKVIQDALGHSDISTTLNIYTDVTKELKTSESKGLDNYFKAQ